MNYVTLILMRVKNLVENLFLNVALNDSVAVDWSALILNVADQQNPLPQSWY